MCTNVCTLLRTPLNYRREAHVYSLKSCTHVGLWKDVYRCVQLTRTPHYRPVSVLRLWITRSYPQAVHRLYTGGCVQLFGSAGRASRAVPALREGIARRIPSLKILRRRCLGIEAGRLPRLGRQWSRRWGGLLCLDGMIFRSLRRTKERR